MSNEKTSTYRWLRWVILAALIIITTVGGVIDPAGADRYRRPRAPRVEIQQDGPMLEVTWHRMEVSGATKLQYRLRGVDRDFRIKGETDKPQIKLVLRNGETYRFSLRAFHPGRGWSGWTESVRVTGGKIRAHPWTVQVQAGDGELSVSWADVEADSYRYRVWSDHRLVRSGSTTETDIVIDSLDNGRTYYVVVRARHGRRFTNRTPALAATPNPGKPVVVELRNYRVEPPAGPDTEAIRTPVSGAAERIESMAVTVAPTNRSRLTAEATFDPSASANADFVGAWVTEAVPIEPLDYELITEVRGAEGVLASSLQTWLLGAVDAFAPEASPETRIGTYR